MNAAMKNGHHEDVRHILKKVVDPQFIDPVMIYDEASLSGLEIRHGDTGQDLDLPTEVLHSVGGRNVNTVQKQGENLFNPLLHYRKRAGLFPLPWTAGKAERNFPTA